MKSFLQKTYLFIIYLFLYTPIIVLIIYSFNTARFSLVWHGFSLQWYHELFQDKGLWNAFFNSTLLGLTASCFATVLGGLACIHFFLNQHQNQSTLFKLLLLLIVLPDLVLGVSLLVFFNVLHIPLGFFSLLLAHITFCLPFVVLTVNIRLKTLDPNIYYQALDLGASKRIAIQKIIMPLLMPAILSSFLLCFTLSFDDVIISYFVSGPDYSILPLSIFSLVRQGVSPELNALCTITFLISMGLVIIAQRITKNA